MPLRAAHYHNSFTGSNGQRPQSQTATILLASSSKASARSAMDRRDARGSASLRRDDSLGTLNEAHTLRVADQLSNEAAETGETSRETRYSLYTFNNLKQM